MAITSSKQEEFVVAGSREAWIEKIADALPAQGFSSIEKNITLFQVTANYRKLTAWGSISITLLPTDGNAKIIAVSTANMDNIFALFKNPNKTILAKFKSGLEGK